MRNKNGDFGMK